LDRCKLEMIRPCIVSVLMIGIILLGCPKSDDTAVDTEGNVSSRDLGKLDWILGTWERKTSHGVMFEDWKVINDNFWEGKSFRLAANDTIILEKLSLVVLDDNVFYVPVVSHNPAPVYFRMIEQSKDKAVFVNPEHDFPQTIIYRKISDDSLHARIEGMNKGVESGVDFYFKRTDK
jgi:hypothetical protein